MIPSPLFEDHRLVKPWWIFESTKNWRIQSNKDWRIEKFHIESIDMNFEYINVNEKRRSIKHWIFEIIHAFRQWIIIPRRKSWKRETREERAMNTDIKQVSIVRNGAARSSHAASYSRMTGSHWNKLTKPGTPLFTFYDPVYSQSLIATFDSIPFCTPWFLQKFLQFLAFNLR